MSDTRKTKAEENDAPEQAPGAGQGDPNTRTTAQAGRAMRAAAIEPENTDELTASGSTDAIKDADKLARQVLRNRKARKAIDAPRFKVVFNGVGPHSQGEVVDKEDLGADERSLGNLLAMGAVEGVWEDDEDEEA